MNKFLSIDQGTTSSRAVLFDANLATLNSYQKEYKFRTLGGGWLGVFWGEASMVAAGVGERGYK